MRKRPLHKGTIIGLYRARGSGTSLLAIVDDRRGKILVPCYGTPTAKLFHEVFGRVLVGGRFHNDAIVGEPIYYRVDELGLLCEFCPVDDKAPPELVEEYAKAAEKESVKAGDIGFVEPDDPRIPKGPERAGKGLGTHPGSATQDGRVYKSGTIVNGVEIQETRAKRKSCDN